jgi:hypothetical protein
MIQSLSWNCNMVQPKLVDTRDLFSMVSFFHADFTLHLHVLILFTALVNL